MESKQTLWPVCTRSSSSLLSLLLQIHFGYFYCIAYCICTMNNKCDNKFSFKAVKSILVVHNVKMCDTGALHVLVSDPPVGWSHDNNLWHEIKRSECKVCNVQFVKKALILPTKWAHFCFKSMIRIFFHFTVYFYLFLEMQAEHFQPLNEAASPFFKFGKLWNFI